MELGANIILFLSAPCGARRSSASAIFRVSSAISIKVSEVFSHWFRRFGFSSEVFSTTFHLQLLLPAIPIHTLVGARVLEGGSCNDVARDQSRDTAPAHINSHSWYNLTVLSSPLQTLSLSGLQSSSLQGLLAHCHHLMSLLLT